ncbi:hypothetical protein [Sphingobium sp.]|uniref:hypothetical protein n=1 Tax=Sphingobium sp. TaxID=1912891 RepID=UPI002E1A47F7
MAEPKPIASLTSGLLARKGAAQPAMRRPMLGFGRAAAAAVQQDDLGWNDMGFDVSGFEAEPEAVAEAPAPIGLTPMPAPAPAVPPVVAERKQLARRVAATIAPATAGRKAAFTLRLDAERHLKLRLAVAVTRRSAQQIVTQALDEYLDNLPEIDRLTKQLPLTRDGQ